MCPPTCATCSGPYLENCLTCASGFYFMPNGFCLSSCPSGFLPINNVCVLYSNNLLFDVTFSSLTATFSTPTGQTLRNGDTMSYYPTFESTDPRPMLRRGFYFILGAYVQLPPSPNTSGPAVVFTNSVSVSIWMRTQKVGYQMIIDKRSATDSVRTFGLDLMPTNTVRISLANTIQNSSNTLAITTTQILPYDQWT